jgi:preprotein translocase subunit SecG
MIVSLPLSADSHCTVLVCLTGILPGGAARRAVSVNTYLYVVQVFVSLVLIGVLLLQARGSGFSATFSSDSSIYRTRRGVEKTLFNVTIILAILFVIVSIISVAFSAI